MNDENDEEYFSSYNDWYLFSSLLLISEEIEFIFDSEVSVRILSKETQLNLKVSKYSKIS